MVFSFVAKQLFKDHSLFPVSVKDLSHKMNIYCEFYLKNTTEQIGLLI